MLIRFACPSCDRVYKVPQTAAGRRAKCKSCGASMQVPEAADHNAASQAGASSTGSTLQFDGDVPGLKDDDPKPRKATASAPAASNEDAELDAFAALDGFADGPVPLEAVPEVVKPTGSTKTRSGFSVDSPEPSSDASPVSIMYESHSPRRRGSGWTPDEVPAIETLQQIVMGLAWLVLGLHALHSFVKFVKYPGDKGMLALAMIVTLVVFFTCDIPGAIGGLLLTSRMMRFEVPHDSYLRMLAVVIMHGVVMFAVTLGLIVAVGVSEESFSKLWLVIPFTLAGGFVVFWIMFPLRLDMAAVGYFLSIIAFVSIGLFAHFTTALVVGQGLQEYRSLVGLTDSEDSTDGRSGDVTVTFRRETREQREERLAREAADEQRKQEMREAIIALTQVYPEQYEDWTSVPQNETALTDRVAYGGGAFSLRPVQGMMLDLSRADVIEDDAPAWVNQPDTAQRRLATQIIDRTSQTEQVVPWVKDDPRHESIDWPGSGTFTIDADTAPTFGHVGDNKWFALDWEANNRGPLRRYGAFVLLGHEQWIVVRVECDVHDVAGFNELRAAALSVQPVVGDPPPTWAGPVAVAQTLIDSRMRHHAVKLLREAGEPAAEAVVQFATTEDRTIAMAVLDLLEQGRSERIVAALQQLAAHRDQDVADRAREAWRRVVRPTALEQAIMDIESTNGRRYANAVRLLADTPPDQRQQRVLARLNAMAQTRRVMGRTSYSYDVIDMARAIIRWSEGEDLDYALEVLGTATVRDAPRELAPIIRPYVGPEHAFALIEATRRSNFNEREPLYGLLAATGDPTAIEVLVAQLENGREREAVAYAILEAGPLAEPALIPLLEHDRAQVRRDAIELLGRIGTDQSVAPLLAAIRAGRGNALAMEARESIDAIRLRLSEQRRSDARGDAPAADDQPDQSLTAVDRYTFIPPEGFTPDEADPAQRHWTWTGEERFGQRPTMDIQIRVRMSLDDDMPRVVTNSTAMASNDGPVMVVTNARTETIEIGAIEWLRVYRVSGTVCYTAYYGADHIVVQFLHSEGNARAIEQMEDAMKTFVLAGTELPPDRDDAEPRRRDDVAPPAHVMPPR